MKKIYYYEHKRNGALLELTKPMENNVEMWFELTEEQYKKAYDRAYQLRMDFGY